MAILRNHLLLRLSTAILFLSIHLTSAVDFLFNGFASSDVSRYGNAVIESRTLAFTSRMSPSRPRAFYHSRIPTKQPNSSLALPFSTSFVLAKAPSLSSVPGFGVVFYFVPDDGSTSSRRFGLFNVSGGGGPNNHVFGVGFDVYLDIMFRDVNDSAVALPNVISVSADQAGYWNDDHKSFDKMTINNGTMYQVWIDYVNGTVNVTMAPAGTRRPKRPLISLPLNLSEVLLDEMYVGFASMSVAGTHRVLAWSFSNTNFSLSEGLITRSLPNLVHAPIYKTKGFVAGLTAGVLICVIICSSIAFFFIRRNRGRMRKKMEEDWELEYWPHRITYKEIESVTKNFSEENVIGIGGNGKVYKGAFPGGLEVAVKRISRESSEGMKAFMAEISSLGRLKHRNLVGLRGWCKKDKRSLILVYDYMENGSLDKRVFDCDENKVLSCEDRIKVLKQVAFGLMYLHHGWKSKVLHRDIKASNVLLDKEMNARLGDFGLARVHDHDKVDGSTRVVGTVGYLAPEVARNGKVSTQTDVFSYGVLILEVVCGRRPIEQGKPLLVEWLWELYRKGELVNGADPRLRTNGEIDEEKVEKMLHLGLLCAHPDPGVRPTMRQVVKLFEEPKTEIDEPEGEETYILEKMKSKEILCSLEPISWSNSIEVGR